MTATVAAIVEQAKNLTAEEREELVDALLGMGPEPEGEAQSVDAMLRELATEHQRRLDDARSGADPGESEDEVFASIEASLTR